MGNPNPNFTVRLPDEIRKPIKEAAERFGLQDADIVRMILAQGVRMLRKDRIVLHARALQKGAA
jgi:hypothetical protein